jgi:lysophospholipase L1-like esterase
MKILFRLTRQLKGTRVFIQSILPTRNLENLPLERIQLLNLELQKIALRYGIEYLDLYPHFLNANSALAEEFSDDGLHLTQAGYQRWVEYLLPVLKTLQ